MTQDEVTTAKMPTTRRALGKAERRQTLIDATITSIANYGLSGTTIARVTEIAGTSIGLANFHFENKERLFEAVLQHLADEERELWQLLDDDARLTPAERLVALVDARFHVTSCDSKKLAVWFAFWGDAGARDIYRRIVEAKDNERLDATAELIRRLQAGDEASPWRDPLHTALGLEAFYDGLWLNYLLYPADFRRLQCRAMALEHLSALFPNHFNSLQTLSTRATGEPRDGRT